MFLPTSPRPPSGMMRMLTGPSWQQPIAITREERRLADVCGADRLRHETLEAEGEASVGRHAVAECVEIRRERGRVEPACFQCGGVVLIEVQPLAAGDDLQPAIQEVEAARPLGPVGVRMRVEGALPRREALDEDELAVLGADSAL